MKIISAEFVISNTDVMLCPDKNIPEYAFIGRSNVGKSSLINSLLNKKSLAKTSSQPGKTQLINHFLINKNWYLVDLPGFGYAKASKKKIKSFQRLISSYFEQRNQLISAFVLIDIRHEPQKIDLNFMYWLGKKKIPFSIIFTKSDKIKIKEINNKINTYIYKMSEQWSIVPKYFTSSAHTKSGIKEILDYISQMNSL
ncbi:MAG: YihA family ribosome biogenesis GTP-binding protein [Flavobacteriaceae bacterium]|nr:YihA family ribosome biogenesis GTP-binding protein [Flavobacteriaceae bacterium]|tara:strand:- start:20411 stop:21004 length:594 start_codon:yes stop_codon:yes gene_type:complete